MPHDPSALAAEYEALSAEERLTRAIGRDFPGRIALASSFGAESVVLLHLLSRVAPATPVLFNETGMLFAETLAYQREVAGRLGLRDVRPVRPDEDEIALHDPAGMLHDEEPDLCCHLRKTRPMERALQPFSAWITGRKRFQADTRADLAIVERDGAGRVKINPLAEWDSDDLRHYMRTHGLPSHPLSAKGYASIGCAPCTTPVAAGEDARAGRWRGQEKVECGIHIAGGRVERLS